MRWGGRPPGPPGCATLPVLEFGSVGERVGDVVLTIVNQDEPRINTKTDGPALLDLLCCDGVMGGSPPGSAGVPPAQHWQSLAHLLDPDRPAKTPGLCLGRAPAVPAGRVEGCAIAGKLSDNPRERVRAGRPRSRVGRFRHDCLSRESRRNRTEMDGRLKSRFDNPFVALRGSLFFPFSFVSNMMINASMQTLSTLHSPLSTLPSSLSTLHYPPVLRSPRRPVFPGLRRRHPAGGPSRALQRPALGIDFRHQRGASAQKHPGAGHRFSAPARRRPRSTWWKPWDRVARCWTMMATAGWMCC